MIADHKSDSNAGWRIGLAVTIIIAFVLSILIWHYMFKVHQPFGWDESHHAYNGLMIAHYARTGNWGMVWTITNRLIAGWPFLYSWITAASLLIFGISFNGARFSSLIFYFFSLPLIYLIAIQISAEKPVLVGILAVVFFGISPLVVYFAVQCMIEMPMIFFLLLLTLLYCESLRSEKIRYPILAGMVIGALFLLKYQNAVVLAPIAIDTLWRWRESDKRALKPLTIIILSFSFVVGVWLLMAIPMVKIQVFINTIKASGVHDVGVQWTTTDRWLFYLRSLISYHTAGIGIFISVIGGFFYSLWRLRGSSFRFVYLFPIIYIFLISISINKQDRYLLPATPFLLIMAAYFLVQLGRMLRRKRYRYLYSCLVGIILISDVYKYPIQYQRIANQIHGSRISWLENELDYSTFFSFFSIPIFLRQPDFFSNPEADYSRPTRTFQDVWEYVYRAIAGKGSLCSLSYHQELSPHLLRWYGYTYNIPVFTQWEPNCRFFMALVISPSSVYYTAEGKRFAEGNNFRWLQHLDQLAWRNKIHLINDKEFNDIGVRVKIYEVTPAFQPK